MTPHANWAWEFKVLESREVNAFCLPGGKVAFYTGIFPVLENEAGLAAVMGHEIAHATARHGGQRITQGLCVQLGLTAAAISLGNQQYREEILGLLGISAMGAIVLPFSRDHELEADRIGLIYMARAGYDPQEGPNLWRRMQKLGGQKPPELLSTHPSDERRIQQLEAMQPQAVEAGKQAPRHYGKGERL
jgi:predicted Zn-dependent protease